MRHVGDYMAFLTLNMHHEASTRVPLLMVQAVLYGRQIPTILDRLFVDNPFCKTSQASST